MSLYSATFYSPELEYLFSDQYFVKLMLKTESALTEAQAKYGLIPDSASNRIMETCKNLNTIDIEKLKQEISHGGNAAIPLVKQLTIKVNSIDPEAAKFIHLGATSQDIVDTATCLMIREFIDWLESSLISVIKSLEYLTGLHRESVMIGRTLLQHARPITFGLKSAYWLESIIQLYDKLRSIKPDILKVQLGGAVGSTNNFITKNVRITFSEILGLQNALPWHTNRLNLLEWTSCLGMVNVQLGKIARDISLLMQTEIAEILEGSEPGKGGSSTMPHKRNPVISALIIANSARSPHLIASLYSVMSQEHERSAGLWHAEWEPLSELMQLTAGSVSHTESLIKNLEVDTVRMKENLEMTHGLIYSEGVAFALVPSIGKEKANELLKSASQIAVKSKQHLRIILESEYAEEVKGLDLNILFDPKHSLGFYSDIIEEILSHSGSIS